MAAQHNIKIPKNKIADFCRRHHIRKLALFGSVLRRDFGKKSDVDVLVEFDPRHVPGLFKLADMKSELSTLIEHPRVDLRTPQDINHLFRDDVISSAEVQYEQK
ncbi:MAG: nucleotidyltransferase domain-containing protein [Acidobacteriota bacterium]|nr:nucleotidyltransferase domain-containing protein [Acidobacteriota bacterium]